MLAMEVRAPGTPVRAIPFGEEGLVTGQNIDSDGTSRAAGALTNNCHAISTRIESCTAYTTHSSYTCACNRSSKFKAGLSSTFLACSPY